MVTVASNAEDARAAAALARVTDGVWATAGLHPHEARDWNHGVMTELRELVDRPEVVALGETGLDFSARRRTFQGG